MNNSKVAIAVSKTISFIQLVGGIILVFMFGLCAIMYLTDKEYAGETGIAFLITCLIITGLGIWLITLSRKKKKLVREFKKYVAVISQDASGYIPDIATSLGTSEDIVKSNIELMIQKEFFTNAYIDRSSNCVVIGNKQNAQTTMSTANAYANSTNTDMSTVEMVTVKCNGCGGINTIAKGHTGTCDYCGSAIKGV